MQEAGEKHGRHQPVAHGRRAFAHLDGARYEPVLLVLVTVAGVASVLAGLL